MLGEVRTTVAQFSVTFWMIMITEVRTIALKAAETAENLRKTSVYIKASIGIRKWSPLRNVGQNRGSSSSGRATRSSLRASRWTT